MRPLSFCAACGAPLENPDGDGARRCRSCKRSWYRNPAPTIACAIVRVGRVLVAVRARAPDKGRFDMPGGFLHAAEQPLDGLRREVREELGVAIDVAHEDYVQAVAHRFGPEGEWLVSLGFKARLVSGEPTPSDDVAEARWVSEDELDGLDWAWDHDRRLAHRALRDG
ncbi:MAG: NUDIX hydrolase [Actinomycetota bacterium]